MKRISKHKGQFKKRKEKKKSKQPFQSTFKNELISSPPLHGITRTTFFAEQNSVLHLGLVL